VAALCGCQIFDTRPAVVVLPSGVLVGKDWIDIRVEAGGAPTARILVDGTPVGDPVSTDQDVRLDISKVAEGVHELVARVEQSSAPRTSAPQRLEVRRVGYRVPLAVTVTSGPWDPVTAKVTSPNVLDQVTVVVTDSTLAVVPSTTEASADRRTVTVRIGPASLKDLGTVVVEANAVDDMGFPGAARTSATMPASVQVTFRAPERFSILPVRIQATTSVPVPSATLWVSSPGSLAAIPIRQVGRSPWDVTIPENELGPGNWSFEFRRDDVSLNGAAYTSATGAPLLASCQPGGGRPGITGARCAVASYRLPPARVELAGTSAAGLLTGDVTVSPAALGAWSVCISDRLWKLGPGPLTADLRAYGANGLEVDRTPCVTAIAWDWTDPGADPVTDGVSPIHGQVLAVHAPSAPATRLAWLGAPGHPGAAEVRVGTRAGAPGAFTPGDALGGATVSSAAAALGPSSVVAWSAGAAPGLVEALLQGALGDPWIAWPPGRLGPEAGRTGSTPAVAIDRFGARAVAWVEASADGSTVIRVRGGPGGEELLPSIATAIAGGFVESPSVAVTAPGFVGPAVAFVDVAPDGSQQGRIVAWDGTGWSPVGPPLAPGHFVARVYGASKLSLAADATRAWVAIDGGSNTWSILEYRPAWTGQPPSWQPAQPHVPSQYSGSLHGIAAIGLPPEGDPVIAFANQFVVGQPPVLLVCRGRAGFLVEELASAPQMALALDADSMTVAWTAADGTIHVRTLTP
jgi:hypothetical protein